jgi:hypothetical protein
MTLDDLIIVAPWIAFGGGLAAIAIALLRARRAAGPGPGKRKRWRGLVSPGAGNPAQPSSGQETINGRQAQVGQCPDKKTAARSR